MSKWLLNIIKYYPVAMNIYISIVMGLYILDIDVNISKYVFTFIGQSFITDLSLFILSIKFKMCIWHRILIINMGICLALETLYNYKLIAVDYPYAVIVLTILASILCVLWNRIRKIISSKR